MKNKKELFFLFIVFLMALFCSCETVKGEPLPEPQTIVYNNRLYAEVDQDTAQTLDLVVDSYSSLTAIGEAEDRGTASFQTIYAYPDIRYPNLIVVLFDNEPCIFQFANYVSPNDADIEDVKDIFGIQTSDAISEIRISKQNAHEAVAEGSIISDKLAIDAFLDAINQLQPGRARSDAYSDSLFFPAYYLKILLSNGFYLTFEYYPQLEQIYFANRFFTFEKTMSDWLNLHLR